VKDRKRKRENNRNVDTISPDMDDEEVRNLKTFKSNPMVSIEKLAAEIASTLKEKKKNI